LSRRNRRSNKYYEILNSLNTFSIKTEPEEERDNFENMHLRNLSANHDMLRVIINLYIKNMLGNEWFSKNLFT